MGERLNRHGQSVAPVLSFLASSIGGGSGGTNEPVVIKQIVVGPAHIALLFEDGRIARLAFSVISDRLDLNKTNEAQSKP